MNAASPLPYVENNRFLQGVDVALVRELRERGRTISVKKASTVYRLAEANNGLYLVVSGSVRLAIPNQSGRELVLLHVNEGEWFGELACTDMLKRAQNAIAVVDSVLWHLPAPAIEQLTARHPIFWKFIAQIQSDHLRRFISYLGCLSEPTICRTIHLLVCNAQDSSRGKVVRLPQEEMAMVLGVTRQTASRCLQELERGNMIKRGYKEIWILSLESLQKKYQEASEAG
ncbi:Crp/Fnr family transcriptional regulator [Paraburkholderia sp. UCT31]|uniref:Crp/Fnr family transcriptional regulator n=1 Tax=Paraburkholderia sp. UCT31 TaxID=2615209 RepID=UPI00165664EE|nr:Crp/Fnr family transcriptional regulator [Paraburkholderia sp. UCT31]MBC8742505.1 Crp/Fnr family transcriptional regulator [Paraburkholderia sp. UCT31]